MAQGHWLTPVPGHDEVEELSDVLSYRRLHAKDRWSNTREIHTHDTLGRVFITYVTRIAQDAPLR